MKRAAFGLGGFLLGYLVHYALGGDPIYWWLILRLGVLG